MEECHLFFAAFSGVQLLGRERRAGATSSAFAAAHLNKGCYSSMCDGEQLLSRLMMHTGQGQGQGQGQG
jgi:hypothetical protein